MESAFVLAVQSACPRIPITQQELSMFEQKDAGFHPKSYEWTELRNSLDGSDCPSPTTRDGMVLGEGRRCQDLGVSTPTPALMAAGAQAPLEYLPDRYGATHPQWAPYAAKLQARIVNQQFGGKVSGCGVTEAYSALPMYYVNTVPHIGFGSVIEYGILFLARATNMRSQLVLGHSSTMTWTSEWFCGKERSLNCYFNTSSCCGALTMGEGGQVVEIDRRRNPISIGLPQYNLFGSNWVSGQLAHFFFSHMTPATRAAIDKRRASVFPRRELVPGQPKCVGMHVRGGDACHAHRYCPTNLTASFFGMASRLGERYGIRRLVLATDSERAAELCSAGVPGFECRTLNMQRKKFDDAKFIEERVKQHQDGELSGSTVALDMMADVDMLADCDALVLVLRSAVSRLSHHLAIARHGHPVPLISLQWPTSPGYSLKGGKGAKGGKGSKGGRKRRLNHSKTEKEKLKLLQREKPGGVKAYKLKKMQAQMEVEMRKAGKFGKGVSEI